jgi:sporulation protein YlmC with PRC-barrel domain
MNTTRKLFLSSAAALTISLAGYAQESTTLGSRDSELKGTAQSELLNTEKLGADPQSTVGKLNRASSLIGMDVRNSENVKLGDVKDVVFDLQSGKISYVVLSVGGFLGIGEKFIAVPPSTFSPGPEHDKLILNADKAKIQNAPSFAKSNWPDVNSPSWNTDSAYWQSGQTAQGTIGVTRSGVGAGEDTTRSNTDLNRSSTDLDRSKTPADTQLNRSDRDIQSSVDRASDRTTFSGRIKAINLESRTMTVEGDSGTKEFKFTERPTIALKENRNPRLADLKVGYPVTVGYHEENGAFMAHSVIRSDAPEVR